jgi:hypothetical protein
MAIWLKVSAILTPRGGNGFFEITDFQRFLNNAKGCGSVVRKDLDWHYFYDHIGISDGFALSDNPIAGHFHVYCIALIVTELAFDFTTCQHPKREVGFCGSSNIGCIGFGSNGIRHFETS